MTMLLDIRLISVAEYHLIARNKNGESV